MSDLSILSNGSYLGAVTLKSLTTASIYALINKYFHGYNWKNPILMRTTAGSFVSSAIAELLMTSIIQRILTLLGKDGNEGIKRIFDQGLNTAISGGLNIKAYEMLVKYAPNVSGSKWMNYEEFIAQAISDVLGEILSFYYLVPLFGLNKTSIMTVYG